jgi:hypothetical protein
MINPLSLVVRHFGSCLSAKGVVSCALFVGACARDSASVRAADVTTSIDSVVVWRDRITLSENSEVQNVMPMVSPDHGRGFLVADMREPEVRVYAANGGLKSVYRLASGKRGVVPALVRAIRLPDGSVLVVDITGGATILDSTGTVRRPRQLTGLAPLYDARALPGSANVLLVGRDTVLTRRNLLHAWSPGRNAIDHSMFEAPRANAQLSAMFRAAGYASVAVVGDSVLAAFDFDPTLRRFHVSGEALGVLPIPTTGFHRIQQAGAPPSGKAKGRKWLETVSRVSDVFWYAGDTVLVQYYDQHGMTLRWRLLGMTTDGRRLFEVRDSPRLLTVMDTAPRLIFVDPDYGAPNKWREADLRVRSDGLARSF